DAWEKRDHAGIRRREEAALNLWKDALQGIPGIGAQIIPDPTNNPLDRLQVFVRPESRFTAAGLASALAAASPPVIVRNHEVERGHFFLDPCNLHPGEAEVVAEQLRAVLTAKDRPSDAMKVARKDSSGSLRWPD
ncbi:MAG: hypothetical protein AB1440_06965, partial [Pseudomonadota bacterium]